MKKILFITLILSALSLTSCRYIDILSSTSSQSGSSGEGESTSKKPSSILPSIYENYVKNSVYYESSIPTSVTNSKYLVLPVWFSDSENLINPGEDKETILSKVTTAFSGTSEETGWNSVKSYYETESNGKKTFDMVIGDWYDCGNPSSEFAGDQNDEIVAENTESLIVRAINNYFNTHPEDKRKDYDSDGDGYLDAVAVVYGAQDYKSEFDFAKYYGRRSGASFTNFWAYVYWLQDPSHQNVNYPGPNAYLWASYDFSNVSKKNPSDYPVKVDAHAYIHETGHLFGLDDYYDYTGSDRPAGSFSMQDYNVGSHDPYSILALGWGETIVPTDTQTITLKPFQDSKQVILLSNKYEDSIFDEYLLLEYYTPTGLNELDSKYCYEGTYPQGPRMSGIRLWHVDARLAYKLGRGYNYDYSDSRITNKIDTQYYYNMLCRNNTYAAGKSADYFSPLAGRYNYANYRLLDLIREGDYMKFRYKSALSGEDLFTAGSIFNMDMYRRCFVERGKLNSGKTLGWEFKVDTITEEGATVSVYKK
ncbi:MAG: hypothetical protein E7178_02360 [Erysipelotrichaceae bacterium]|nr:hypothetical protein [Erysipelotrichaceae bacterium]